MIWHCKSQLFVLLHYTELLIMSALYIFSSLHGLAHDNITSINSCFYICPNPICACYQGRSLELKHFYIFISLSIYFNFFWFIYLFISINYIFGSGYSYGQSNLQSYICHIFYCLTAYPSCHIICKQTALPCSNEYCSS